MVCLSEGAILENFDAPLRYEFPVYPSHMHTYKNTSAETFLALLRYVTLYLVNNIKVFYMYYS